MRTRWFQTKPRSWKNKKPEELWKQSVKVLLSPGCRTGHCSVVDPWWHFRYKGKASTKHFPYRWALQKDVYETGDICVFPAPPEYFRKMSPVQCTSESSSTWDPLLCRPLIFCFKIHAENVCGSHSSIWGPDPCNDHVSLLGICNFTNPHLVTFAWTPLGICIACRWCTIVI